MLNIKTCTALELFDYIEAFLLKQNSKSMTESGLNCAYRGQYGRMCAVGCVLPDEHYSPSFEGKLWVNISYFDDLPTEKACILSAVQALHDLREVESWPQEFKEARRALFE